MNLASQLSDLFSLLTVHAVSVSEAEDAAPGTGRSSSAGAACSPFGRSSRSTNPPLPGRPPRGVEAGRAILQRSQRLHHFLGTDYRALPRKYLFHEEFVHLRVSVGAPILHHYQLVIQIGG